MKCQYCKRDFKNPKVHERFCEQNPNKAHPWPKEMMKSHDKEIQESQSSSSSFSKPLQQPPSTLAAHDTSDSLFRRIFLRKKQHTTKAATIEEIISSLPKWSIKEGKPWFVGENKKRKLIQFVGVSRLKPPVMAWIFWDGIFISVEDRLYQPPHDIRGNVFFYDLDNSKPLLDNIQEDEETHESLRMAQVKNIAYSMGRIAGAQDLLKNLGLILLGIGFIVLLGIANLYLSYQTTQGFGAANAQIGNITVAVRDYIATHP